DGTGGAVVTVSDDRTGRDCDIYAQRVDASGKVLWKVNGISICDVEKDQGFPQVASDEAGGAIVAWADFRGGTDFSIYAQRVDASGRVLWQKNGVPVCTARGSRLPRVASDGVGGAIIVWRDPRNTSDYDIYAQRVDGAGRVLWGADGLAICTIEGGKWWPLVTADGVGGAIVVWRDYRSGTNYDVYAQRVDASGSVLWKAGGMPLCTEKYNERYHGACPDGSGGAIVTWYEDRSGDYDIYAQRVDSRGRVVWKTEAVPVCTAPEDQQFPIVVPSGLAGTIVTWVDYRSGTNFDIYAQRVKANGSMGPFEDPSHRPQSGACR
ncbi:MAG: hypothetical protein V2A71_07055, partial [Candidatus Eisenbacteria bacterium]